MERQNDCKHLRQSDNIHAPNYYKRVKCAYTTAGAKKLCVLYEPREVPKP